MTSETASDAMKNTNKRVRTEEPTSALQGLPSTTHVSTNQSPKGCALTSVSTFAVTLRRHLSPIVKKAAESHIDLLHKLITKMNQFTKMDDDSDFIPRSARMVNFDFRVTKKVENSPEFLAIKADTDTLVLEFKLALKQKIMKTLELECKLLREDLYAHLCINIHMVVQAFLITEQVNLDPHKVISTILQFHFKELWDHTDLKLIEFYQLYKSAHALTTFPFPLDDLTTETHDDTTTMNAEDTDTITFAHPSCNAAKIIISGAFTTPGTAYFSRVEEIKIDISLKKLLATNKLEEATEATKNRLDAEISVDNDLLEDIIQKKVIARTKNLNSELGQLKKQMAALSTAKHANPGTLTQTSKKERRGRPPKKTGASTLKKKSAQPRPQNGNVQPAVAPAKGSSRRKPGGKPAPGTKKKKTRKQS